MPTKAKLKDIADELSFQTDESTAYFDVDTGKVFTVGEEEGIAVEADCPLEDSPEWQHEVIELARKVANDKNNRYLELPSKWDFHEYAVMERFFRSVEDQERSDVLCITIQGSGAFRRFKEMAHRFGIIDDWYQYRDNALKELAVDWCEEHEIEYE